MTMRTAEEVRRDPSSAKPEEPWEHHLAEVWWMSTGRFIDPNTSDVPWEAAEPVDA
jgi:hypothetical protein